MRVRFGMLVGGLVASCLASFAFATPQSAWTKAGAPIAATGSFAAPPADLTGGAYDPLKSNALYEDHSGGGIFDEVRLGVLGFWQNNAESVQGVYITGQVLFDPFVRPFNNPFLNVLLRPRPHIGGTVSDAGPDQLFAGLTWNVPVWRRFFVEASFGGTIHDGAADRSAGVARLPRAVPREPGLGVDIGQHWRAMVGVDHSSHAELCGQHNDGLTHLGG